MGLTIRQIIVGTVPTVVAILGFLWFRRKKKDPAICQTKEGPKSAQSQNRQRHQISSEPVATEPMVAVIEKQEVAIHTEALLESAAGSSLKQGSVCDKVADISSREISAIESQILSQQSLSVAAAAPSKVEEQEEVVVPLNVSETSQESSQLVETEIEIVSAPAHHIQTQDNTLKQLNGDIASEEVPAKEVSLTESSVEEVGSLPACTKSECHTQVAETADTNGLPNGDTGAEVVGVSAEDSPAEDSPAEDSPVEDSPAEKEADISATLPATDSVSDWSAENGVTANHMASGDENANTDSKSCRAPTQAEDYRHTNGHVEKDQMEANGGAGDRVLKAEVTKVNQSAPDSDQNNVDGTDAQSEVSSDSGRGASGIETPTATSPNELSDFAVYEFDFPTEICGKLIGKAGKNINSVKAKTGAEIILKRKPFIRDFQNCCIEGTQSQVQAALEHIKRRFPSKLFSNLTYRQTNVVDEAPTLAPEIMQMSLPEGVSVDVVVSSVVAANHVFVQQPTHPTFSSLESLNYCMNVCYTQDNVVPQLPRPIEAGVICAAPVFQGWYRAQVMAFYPATDECDIKYVDYGGYMRVVASTLRQIRSDFATLPFQAVECYLANVMPLDDSEEFGVEATVMLESLVQGQMLQAQITDHEADGVPYVQLYNISGAQAVFVNRELVENGVARWVELQG